MKKTFSLLFAALFVAAMPMAAIAQSHGGHDSHSGHGAKSQSTHEQMHGDHVHGKMIMLGAKVVDGVKAEAHLDDVRAAMAKAGMKETHHLMVFFVDAKTGDPIETGTAALKVREPGGTETGPVRMVGMEGHFGADIELKGAGHYEFTIGSRLPDGKARQFEFMYMLN